MEMPLIDCSRCKATLPPSIFNVGTASCPICKVPITAYAFPALLKPVEPGKVGEVLLVEGESSCFYHSEKKAVVTCSYCGRFLCALCDVDFNGEHLCPPCIESGKKKGKMKNLENRRVLYDDIAMALAVVPILFYCVIPVTAPIALYVSIKNWNRPTSIVPRGKGRFIAAMVIASLQILGMLGLLIAALVSWKD